MSPRKYGPLLTVAEAAARVGIEPVSWRKYVQLGYAPPADETDEDQPPNRRRPRWYASTVDRYIANRPGKGARTDLLNGERP